MARRAPGSLIEVRNRRVEGKATPQAGTRRRRGLGQKILIAAAYCRAVLRFRGDCPAHETVSEMGEREANLPHAWHAAAQGPSPPKFGARIKRTRRDFEREGADSEGGLRLLRRRMPQGCQPLQATRMK